MPTTAVSLVTGLLPGLDSDITRYISGIWDEHDEDISEDDSEDGLRDFVRPLLEGEGVDEEEINAVLEQIRALRPDSPSTSSGANRTAKRLDKAIDMKSNPSVSFTANLKGPVDIESTTKGRTTQVDLKKLEKAEAKIKAKMEKRARRTVEFEGSKLVDAAKAQKAYEEMYMTVNPLQLASANKGKSKDILLEAIDVSYGSNSILTNATYVFRQQFGTRSYSLLYLRFFSLTLAHGRRYGLIGKYSTVPPPTPNADRALVLLAQVVTVWVNLPCCAQWLCEMFLSHRILRFC